MNTLLIAKHFECKASIVWKNNRHLDCDFNNLFYERGSFEVVPNINNLINQESSLCSIHNMAITKYKHTSDFMVGIRNDMLNIRALREEYIKLGKVSSFNKDNQVIIKAMSKALLENDIVAFRARKDFSRFYNISYSDIFHNNLMPLANIQSLVDSYIDNNSFKNILGVQVRRGDLSSSSLTNIRIVPINKYFEKIDYLLKINRYEKIFLATESVDIIGAFHKRYKDMVINYPIDEYSRSGKGVVYALVDMILLSKCTLIISGRSQLPATAAKIGNIEHIRLV